MHRNVRWGSLFSRVSRRASLFWRLDIDYGVFDPAPLTGGILQSYPILKSYVFGVEWRLFAPCKDSGLYTLPITYLHILRHYENLPIQIYWKVNHRKIENFQTKNSNIFHISAQNIDCGYSLEPPRGGGSNEYPQSIFCAEIRKIMYTPVNPSFTI